MRIKLIKLTNKVLIFLRNTIYYHILKLQIYRANKTVNFLKKNFFSIHKLTVFSEKH